MVEGENFIFVGGIKGQIYAVKKQIQNRKYY
jgi:hypothetical protein